MRAPKYWILAWDEYGHQTPYRKPGWIVLSWQSSKKDSNAPFRKACREHRRVLLISSGEVIREQDAN